MISEAGAKKRPKRRSPGPPNVFPRNFGDRQRGKSLLFTEVPRFLCPPPPKKQTRIGGSGCSIALKLWRKRNTKSTGENSKCPVETAPRICRFVSIVVVERVLTYPNIGQSRSQKILVMKFCIFTPTPQREKLGGFLVANFLSFFPKEKWLEICHSPKLRKFHHIFHGKERNLSPGTRSGGDFT